MTTEIKVNVYSYNFSPYDRDLGESIIISKYRPHEYTACKSIRIPTDKAQRFYKWLEERRTQL